MYQWRSSQYDVDDQRHTDDKQKGVGFEGCHFEPGANTPDNIDPMLEEAHDRSPKDFLIHPTGQF